MTFEEELRRLSEGKGVSKKRFGSHGLRAVEQLYGFKIDASIKKPFRTEVRHKKHMDISYVEMQRILERGKSIVDGTPIDIKNFDSVALKTLEELHTEIREREVMLLEYEDGIIECFAISTKTAVEAPSTSLHETSRTYKKGIIGREVSIPAMQDYAVSETLIKGELPPECVVRGFKQELGIEICQNDLQPLLLPDEPANYADLVRPSRVYTGLQSRKGNFWFRISFPERFGPDEIVFEDHGTELVLTWI